MTLVSVPGSGRCDARCYGARDLDCDCVCGGMNHGKGLARAEENTRAHGWRWVREHGGRGVVLGEAVEQMEILWE